MCAGHRRLEDDGEAELAGGLDGFVCGLSHALGHDRDAVGREQPPGCVGVQPCLSVSGERVADDAARLLGVDLGADGDCACGAPEPLRARRREAEGPRGRLGVCERCDRAPAVAERRGRPVPADQHGEHRLVGARATDGILDCDRDLVGSGDHRWHEEDDQGVESLVLEQRRNHGFEGRAGRGAEQVNGVGEARVLRQQRLQGGSGRLAQLGQLEPGRGAGVGAEDSETAGIRHHAHAAAARQWLAREEGGRVDQLLERVGANDARLAEERLHGGVGARQSARCASSPRALRPRSSRP